MRALGRILEDEFVIDELRVAGVIAQVASVETVGGEVTNLKVSLDTYNGVFWTIGLVAAGIGVLLLLISPLIKRWMHGVQ